MTADAVHADRAAAAAYIRAEIARSTGPWPLAALSALADTIELGDHTGQPDDARQVCQIADPGVELPCPVRDSGGIRCEVDGPHDRHQISDHTTAHALVGNGYACTAVSRG